jgi:hypothetical protein
MPEQVQIIDSNMQLFDYGNVGSVAPAAVNNAVIPCGNNIHAIMFHALSVVPAPLIRAELIADIASIQIELNGELIYDRTVTECLDEYKGEYDKFGALAAPLGTLVVPFTDLRLPIWEQRRGGAIGMLRQGSTAQNPTWNVMTYRLTMDATVATAVQVEVRVLCDRRPPETTGLHIRRLRTTRNIGAVGDNHLNDLPTNFYGINRYDVVTAAGNITSVTVDKDNARVINNAHVDVLDIINDQAGWTPQAGYQTILFNQAADLQGCERLRGAVVKWDMILNCAIAPGAGTVILSEEVHDTIRQ